MNYQVCGHTNLAKKANGGLDFSKIKAIENCGLATTKRLAYIEKPCQIQCQTFQTSALFCAIIGGANH